MLKRQYEVRIDREKYIEELLIEIINHEKDSTDAVVFYGRSGIGKSSLSKSLYNKITQYYSDSTIIDGEEILNNCVTSNSANAALFQLRKFFLKNNSNLSCFDIVYLLYAALANTSEGIDLSTEIAQKIQIVKIIEIVKKGLYEFPLFLENTKFLDHYQRKRKSESVLLGSKIFACLNWFFIQQTETIRQWWKLRGSQDLQELKDCVTLQDILKLLPLFLSRDLQLNLQENPQKIVVLIDNYEYLVDAEDKYNWLKNLIKFNSPILWIILAKKPVYLTSNTQNIPIKSLTDTESQAIVQKFGVDNPEISQLIIQASQGIPLYLRLGIETYQQNAKHKKPQEIAGTLQDILSKLNAAWDWYERRIWQILSNCASWDEVLFGKLISQFGIVSCNWICDCWNKLFHKVVKSPFVELSPQGFRLHPIVREYLYHNQPDNLQQSINDWLFEYYQKEYQRLPPVELRLTELQPVVLIKSLEHGLKSQQQQKAIDWLLEEIKLQQQAGRHQFCVFTLQFFLKYQQNALGFTLLGKSLLTLKDYQQALVALQTAQKLWKNENIQQNLALADVELSLAACYLKLQRTSEADIAAKKALRIRNTQLNENYLEIAEVLNIKVEIAFFQGYYSEALKLSQQILQIFESHQNIPFLQIAQTKFTIGWLNAIDKKCGIALNQFQQTLDILKLVDETHPLAISSHEMLGNIYQKMGYFRYQQAYEEYKLALETAEINLGLTHPQTLQLITAIVNFSRIRGEYDTVDFLAQRRHANMETSHFKETAAVADRLNKLGCLLYQQGKYAFSENLLQQALQINCKVLSKQHAQTAESFHNLGLLYKTQRRYYTAEVYFKQSLQIRSQILGEQHPTTANSLNSLAALYCCMGQYEQAEPLLQQALEICQNNFGEMHPHTATTLNNLAQMYLCQELNAKAEPLFQQALDICVSVLGESHPYTKTVESNFNRLRDNS